MNVENQTGRTGPVKTFRQVREAVAKTRGTNDKARRGIILLIDEAGMVGTRQLTRIVEMVEQQGGKVVLVGDDKQLQPLEAGGSFRALAERLEGLLKTKLEEWGVGFGKLAQPIRVAFGVAVSGTTVSPQIVDTLLLLGRKSTIARIKRCSAQCSSGPCG